MTLLSEDTTATPDPGVEIREISECRVTPFSSNHCRNIGQSMVYPPFRFSRSMCFPTLKQAYSYQPERSREGVSAAESSPACGLVAAFLKNKSSAQLGLGRRDTLVIGPVTARHVLSDSQPGAFGPLPRRISR